MEDSLEHERAKATPDVLATLDWLTSSGWTVTSATGSATEHFGNVVIQLRSGDDGAIITRDRGQWMMDLRLVGWSKGFDFDLVMAALDGVPESWGPSTTFGGNLPQQLPEGVSWSESLPRALNWGAATPDAEHILKDLGRKRGRLLFPPQKRRHR